MESGIEYEVTEDGLNILLIGPKYRELGLRLKQGENLKPFLKSIKRLIKDLNALP